MRVAVDGMGGDHAPDEIVKGSLLALERNPDLSVLLVGDEPVLARALESAGKPADRVSIRHASEVIEMGESPVEALRAKPDSSIQRCVEALRNEDVDAVVSAGDTGAVVAASTLFVKRLKGVKRHGIAIPIPTRTGLALLIDVGANIHCKPINLLQYAIMASSYAQEVMGIEHPRVALLSVGEEEAKGTDLVKKTRNLLSRLEIEFVGNVEGQAIFQGDADVVVCDGFVGNVVLKVAEGFAESFLKGLMAEILESTNGRPELLTDVRRLKEAFDYASTGGAPLLGVQGSIIICHGRSNDTAVANAIQVATEFTTSRVNDRIVEEVARVSMLGRMVDFFHMDQS